jgi:hypothetical protein
MHVDAPSTENIKYFIEDHVAVVSCNSTPFPLFFIENHQPTEKQKNRNTQNKQKNLLRECKTYGCINKIIHQQRPIPLYKIQYSSKRMGRSEVITAPSTEDIYYPSCHRINNKTEQYAKTFFIFF